MERDYVLPSSPTNLQIVSCSVLVLVAPGRKGDRKDGRKKQRREEGRKAEGKEG